MSSLKEIRELADSLLNTDFTITKFNGEIEKINLAKVGYTVGFDNAKRRAGRCIYGEKITLSKPIVLKNLDRVDSIKDTILHEIAHGVSVEVYGLKGSGHGKYWKDVAKQIGAKPQRCFTSEKFELPDSKYSLVCGTCDERYPRHKKPPRHRRYSCPNCCKRFDPNNTLTLVTNF